MATPVAAALPGKRPGTRDRILTVALRLFAEKGYDATSMREIAEHLGITKAALYYHFDSKADIVRAMLADVEQQTTGLVEWARAQPRTPDLPRVVLERWGDIMQDHGLSAFRFVVANPKVVNDLDPEPRSGMHHCLGELHALLTPPDASVEAQLRTRLALMAINMAGLAGADIDAEESEVLAAARRLALDLLPPA